MGGQAEKVKVWGEKKQARSRKEKGSKAQERQGGRKRGRLPAPAVYRKGTKSRFAGALVEALVEALAGKAQPEQAAGGMGGPIRERLWSPRKKAGAYSAREGQNAVGAKSLCDAKGAQVTSSEEVVESANFM